MQEKEHHPRESARRALEVPWRYKPWPSDSFDALIALGCIIRGETYHFELVANEVWRRRDATVARLPDPHRQRDHHHRKHGASHCPPGDKGTDAARVAVEMANLLDELS